jgi:hypothetical protein
VVIGNNNNWEDVRLVLLRAELINHDADVIKATIGNTNNLYLGLESVEIELQSIYANMHDNVWIRTKTAITTSGIKSTGTIPWHAHVNFIKIPPMLMPKQVLTNYLKTRGIQVNTTTDRSQLVILVKHALTLNKSILPSVVYESPNELGSYIDEDRFICPDMSPIQWIDDLSAIVSFIRSNGIQELNYDVIDNLWDNRSAIKYRAVRIFKGGHLLINTLSKSTCMFGNASNSRQVNVFKLTVMASMKNCLYNVFLAFDAETKLFLHPPISSCECPAGQMMCSHTIASLILFLVLQYERDPIDIVVKCLPTSVKEYTSLNIPLEFCHQI